MWDPPQAHKDLRAEGGLAVVCPCLALFFIHTQVKLLTPLKSRIFFIYLNRARPSPIDFKDNSHLV